jgi:hypothetical protein
MATSLDKEILSLEKKIQVYKNELKIATTAEEKSAIQIRGLIKSCSDNLNELLKQKNSQSGISFSRY